jgi:hypothetical protein
MRFLKLLNVQGIVGIVASVVLLGLFSAQWIEARHWHKQSDRYERLYNAEHSAFATTVSNYRTAAEQARKADAEHKAKVEADQRAVTERTAREYEARIADVRARYERLRPHAGTVASGPVSPPVPVVPSSTQGADGTPAQGGLPADDALVATEQAIQLDELIQWVRQQTTVNSPPNK